MAQGLTIQSMLKGNANRGTAGVPTQTFAASNIAGTTLPKVGNAQGAAGYSNAGAMAGVSSIHVALFVVAIIGVGYLLHHFNFEESLKV